MREILAVGGSAFLIPVVLFVLLLYVIRGLFGLHGRRSQNRKEFLELWDTSRARDDLWLEVAVRHLFGTYLPAHVIRLALQQPDKAQSLLDLSELWPLLRFNPESRTVTWQNKRHSALAKRRLGLIAPVVGYYVCAVLAFLAAIVAFGSPPTTVVGWLCGVCAVLFGVIALICLFREDTIKVASLVGHIWIDRVNQSADGSHADKRVLTTPYASPTSATSPQSGD